MKNEFTKGEWSYGVNNRKNIDIYIDGTLKTIATIPVRDVSYMPTKQEAEANAKLIAAAPELLEALQEAYKCSGEKNHLTKPVLDLMLSAIKKATT